jgi:hypothetical protein
MVVKSATKRKLIVHWGIKEGIAHHLAYNRNLGQLVMLRKSDFDSMYEPLMDADWNKAVSNVQERDEIWEKLHDVETNEHLVQLGIVNHESVFFDIEKGRYFWVEINNPHIPIFKRKQKSASRIKEMNKVGNAEYVLQWFPLSVLTPEMLHTDLWEDGTPSGR